MKLTKTINCRVCTKTNFKTILDLGTQKIANYFHEGKENIPEAPLELIRCTNCNMVQLQYSVDTDAMYRRYWYRSGVNQTMRSHLAEVAQALMDKVELTHGDPIIDIGCNDGTLLAYLPDHADKIGVDPSNVTPKNCTHIQTYFSAKAVEKALHGRKAKVISSIAMFYDLDNPKKFVQDIKNVLDNDGIWVLELSYLPRMIENAAYDSICHEHVTYYTLRTFMKTIEGSGMHITDIQFNDVNGGSFRIFLSPSLPTNPIVYEVLAKEDKAGYETDAPYRSFTERVNKSREDLISFLEKAREQGKKVYGYGASTKGQIVLQYCRLDTSHMVAIAERNPRKYGFLTPGTNIPICPETEMRDANPDYLVIFPWYFIDEFVPREKALQDKGCKLIVPLPEVKTI